MPSTPFHYGVNLQGIHFEDFMLTVALKAGITKADEGKAVTKDGTTANGYKLAGDGDPIHGRLLVVEPRTVEGQLIGTVEFVFANILPIAANEVVPVGAYVVGAGSGTVKDGTVAIANVANAANAAETQDLVNVLKAKVNEMITKGARNNMVVKVVGTNAVVLKL